MRRRCCWTMMRKSCASSMWMISIRPNCRPGPPGTERHQGSKTMKIGTMTAAAVTLALLAACSKAPEEQTTTAAAETAATPAAAATALPRTPAPAGARVFIVSPKDGETVTSPVRVVFGVEGMGVVPAGEQNATAGHHHLLVDTDLADAG